MDRQMSLNNILNTNMSYVELLEDALDVNTQISARSNSSRYSLDEGSISRIENSQTRSSNTHPLINLNCNPRNSEANNNMVNNNGSRKRKETDGGYASGSSSFANQGESNSMHPHFLHQNANATLRIDPLSGDGENSNRNCRVRINPPNEVSVNNYLPINQDATNSFVPWNLPNPNSIALAQNMHPTPMAIASSFGATRNSSSVMSRNIVDASHLNPMSRRRTLRQCTRIPQQVDDETLLPLHIGSRQNININVNVPPQPSGSSNTVRNMHESSVQLSGSLSTVRNVHESSSQTSVSLITVRNIHESSSQRVTNIISSIEDSYSRFESGVVPDLSTREGRRRFYDGHVRVRDVPSGGREQLNMERLLLLNHAILHGWAVEMPDRHSDMRLDVDNMSYEELLALEERIGDVNMGLDEGRIMKCLKQRKYISLNEDTPDEVEPCCICQEIFVEMEDVGRLGCGHDFHAACIKKWLTLKNLCPICKTTGTSSK